MASNAFEKKIQIVVEGFENLREAQSGTEEWQKAVDSLSQALVDLEKSSSKMGEGAAQGARKLSKEMQAVQKAAAEANKALRELVEADISSGGKGDPSKLVGGLGKGQILAAQQWRNYSTSDVVTANKQAEKSFEELQKSVGRLSKAYEDSKKAIPQSGQSRMKTALNNEEAATEALAKARWEYMQMLASGNATQDQTIAAHNRIAKAQVEASKATSQLEKESERAINTLPRLRYALYDVSRTLTRMGAGMLGAATSVGVVSTKMSRDFADVIRTTETFRDVTGQSTAAMRKDFEDLYKSTPADWSDITRIGEMAGQMGIASDEVSRFSDTVSRLAVSTDLSVDSAATAIGRLSELLNVSADEYNNLASSILSVGVNSVATEAQITEISQQIAGIAGTAGLTADEVIGLSSALASIGTAPELSRGIVTRFFTNLMSATAEGGERLEKFAAVSGMTAAQFKHAWETDAAGAFQAVIKGLGQVEQSDAIHVLRELGIQQVRDIPAVLKLSQNYELLARSMNIAADGYSNATALAEHSGVVYEEMSEKIVMLKNQFALLMDAVGQFTQSDLMKGLVDQITRALELLTALANHPVASEIIKWGVIISGTAGALALLGAALTAAIASHAGLKTALIGLNMTLNSTKTATDFAGMGIRQLGVEMWKTDAAAKVLRVTLASIGVGAAIAAITYGFSKLAESAQKAKEAAQSFSGLHDAIRADTQAYQEAVAAGDDVAGSYRIVDVASREAAEGSEEMSDSLRQILGVTDPVAGGLRDVAGAAEEATIALGKEYAAAVARSIAENEHLLNKLDEGADQLAEAGFKVTDFARAMAQGTAGDYLQGMLENLDQLNAEAGNVPAHLEKWGTATRRIAGDFLDAYQAIDILREAAGLTEEELNQLNLTSEITSAVLEDMGLDAESLEEAFNAASDSANGFRSILTDFDTSAYDLQGTFYDLAEAVIQNEGVFDEFSAAGRANMRALESAMDDLWASADGDAQVFAANLADAFAYVEGAGYNLVDSVDVLHQAMQAAFLNQWGVSLDTRQAHGSIAKFLSDVIAALRARAELERDAAGQAMASARATPSLQAGIHYGNIAAQHEANVKAINSQISAVQNLAKNLGSAGDAGTQAGRQIRNGLSGGGRGGGRKSPARKAADDVKNLKEELYTLKDYASDLSEIWSRAFDIRFSGQKTIDSVTSSLRGMAQRFEDAEKNVRDLKLQLQSLRGDLSGLRAELSKQEYFLSIALEYGDTKRAEQIQARIVELQAELAKKQAEVSDTSKDLSKAQEATSRSLEGNSEAAIQNRSDLMDLVKQYQDHVKALAESGMSSQDLQKETEKLRQDFIKQATQMGFNRQELKKYEQGFKDMKVAIDRVPRNITVKANTNPAMQAVNEWIAKVNRKKASMRVNANIKAPKSLGGIGGQLTPSSIRSSGPIYAPSLQPQRPLTFSATLGGGGRYIMQMRRKGGLANTEGPLYRASGGPAEWAKMYARGTDTIPAMLTPGEYVVQKKAVDFYGPEVMRAINNMKVPKRFFSSSGNMQNSARASGTLSNGQRVMVDLSPSSVQAVAQAVQPILKVDNKTIQQANGSANSRSSRVGAL